MVGARLLLLLLLLLDARCTGVLARCWETWKTFASWVLCGDVDAPSHTDSYPSCLYGCIPRSLYIPNLTFYRCEAILLCPTSVCTKVIPVLCAFVCVCMCGASESTQVCRLATAQQRGKRGRGAVAHSVGSVGHIDPRGLLTHPFSNSQPSAHLFRSTRIRDTTPHSTRLANQRTHPK